MASRTLTRDDLATVSGATLTGDGIHSRGFLLALECACFSWLLPGMAERKQRISEPKGDQICMLLAENPARKSDICWCSCLFLNGYTARHATVSFFSTTK